MVESSAVARRVDLDGGFYEEAAFRDVRGSRVFAVAHVPSGVVRAGVVICTSILVEQLTNYRNEVLLARALAARGVAVQRFHYRGTGHSGGDEADASFETMVDDALAAAAYLRERAGVTMPGFVGTRWGALVAGAAAQRHPQSPLVLWEPVVDGGRYFRELLRARLVRELKDTRFAGAGADSLMGELERTGHLDILGYTLRRTIFESGQGIRLDRLLDGRPGPVLLVQFGRQTALRPDYTRLKDGLKAVEVRFIRDEPAWFFPGHLMRSIETLIGETADWMLTAAAGTRIQNV